MYMNEYVLETLTRERLAEMRAEGARANRVWAATRPSRPLRVALGDVLIRIGRRLRRVRGYSSAMNAGGAVNTERTTTHGAVRG